MTPLFRRHRPGDLALTTRERVVHFFFDVGVVIKGIDGVLQIIGGGLLLVLKESQVQGIVRALTQHELSRDRNDILARALSQAAESLSADARLFGAIYLLIHGVVKVGLVSALLRRQFWAYPAAMIVFALFVVYQMYRYTHTQSGWLVALSVLDLFVIVITWLEYKRLKTSHAFA